MTEQKTENIQYCKSLSQLSSVAAKVVIEDTQNLDLKQLLAKCIDTLSIYKTELRKLSCITEATPVAQAYELNESLYVYFKIVSQIASQVIPTLAEFQRAKSSSKLDPKNKELLDIYSKLVSALANDKKIAGIKKFIREHNQEVSQEAVLRHFNNGDSITVTQLHALIRHEAEAFNILIIDIRPRMLFNSGHIKYSNIICIEPISFKESYTDLDILRKALITASDKESSLFKNRDKFPMIVLYTDDNEHTNYYLQQLQVLQDILINRSFELPLTNSKVVIMRNGFEAWKRKYPNEIELFEEEITPKMIQTSDKPYQSKMMHIPEVRSQAPSRSSTPGFTHYPDAPFLTNGNLPKTMGLTPQPLLPSTSNLTKALQQQNLAPTNFNNSLNDFSNHNTSNANTLYDYDHGSKKNSNVNNTAQLSNINLDFTVGLTNLGNSCYLNCIIQCLLGCHELSYIFLTNSYKKHINLTSRLGSKGLLASYFAKLVQKMYQQGKILKYNSPINESTAVHPAQFKMACGSINSLFKDRQQQDCQEFCQFLLDGLHEDLNQCGNNPPLKELSPEAEKMRETMPMRIASSIEWERYLTTDFSVVVDLFQGQYASRLKCKVCGHTSTTYQAFSVLSVPVPKTKSCTIYDCFNEFTKLETLEKDELWNCPHCKMRQPSTKQILITRLPNNLIIHLKRFDNMLNKNNVFVHYPHELDLTSFWVSDYNGEMPKDNGVSLPLRGQKPPFRYNLFAVASHSGTLYGGHYTSFVDKGSLGWCNFDDVSWRKIKRENEYITPNAYVLFYRRVST